MVAGKKVPSVISKGGRLHIFLAASNPLLITIAQTQNVGKP
jgi:hypothetical protein